MFSFKLEKILSFNQYLTFFWSTVGFLAIYVFLYLLRNLIIDKFEHISSKTKNTFDNSLLKSLKQIKLFFLLGVSLYISYYQYFDSENLKTIRDILSIAGLTIQVILMISVLIDETIRQNVDSKQSESSNYAAGGLKLLLKVLLWTFGIFFVLSNAGINITSLIAGLGIGGVAVAFALQNILSDLFSSFAIYFDKPFIVGDFIIVKDKMGIVEKIGIKSTRIRALQGEEIVISNQELTSVHIQNFKKLEKRRAVFTIGVVYETPKSKLKKISFIIKKIITKIPKTEFDRAHLVRFDASSLTFEVVYFILSGDYNEYMDIQHDINLNILEEFAKEKISMAYPTSTVYVTHSSKE